MKTVLILCVTLVLALSILFAAQFSRSKVNLSYDKFDDLTEVSTTAANVDNAIGLKQEKQDLRLQVFYKCTGDTSHCRPEEVELKFALISGRAHPFGLPDPHCGWKKNAPPIEVESCLRKPERR